MANMQDYEDDSSMTEVQDSDIQKWLEVIRDEASEKGIDLSDEDKFTDLAIEVLDNDPKQISEDQVAEIITKLKAACDECDGDDDTDDDDQSGAASKAAKQMESVMYSTLVLLTESEDVKEVCDEDGVHISEVLTFAGALAVCKGTRWALGDSEKTFSAYQRQGNIYHVKIGRARYLMQPATSTYVDKADRVVPAAKLSELLDACPKLKVAIKTTDLTESAYTNKRTGAAKQMESVTYSALMLLTESEDVKEVCDEDGVHISEVLTFAGALAVCKGTRWALGDSEKTFSAYERQGKIYHVKIGSARYLMQPATSTYVDKADRVVPAAKLSELLDACPKLKVAIKTTDLTESLAEDVKEVCDEDGVHISEVVTFAGALAVCKGTRWALGDSEKTFSAYKRQGKIYHVKIGSARYLMQPATSTYVDKADRVVPAAKLSELLDACPKLKVAIKTNDNGVHISEVVTFAGAEAACKGTRWALGDSEKTFSAYKRQGKIYHVKIGSARYLMHPATSTYVDKADRVVPAAKLSELLDKYPDLEVAIKASDLSESVYMGRNYNFLFESEDVKEVCNEDGVNVSEVVTFAGAVAVCKGTRWNLGDDEKTFSTYKRQGEIYHVKVGNARFLMHPATSTYVDKSDRFVPATKLRDLLDKCPSLKVAIKSSDLNESVNVRRKSNVLVEQQLQQLRRFAGINESSCSYREMQEDETPRQKTGAERDAERRAALFASMDDDDDDPVPATKKTRVGGKPKPSQTMDDADQGTSGAVDYDDIPAFDESDFEKYNQRGGNRKIAGHDENKNANYGYRVLHKNPRMPRGMFIEHMVNAKGVAKNYAATLYQQIKKRRADGHVDMTTGLPNGLHRKSARDTFGESYMFFHPTNPDFVLVEDAVSGKYRWADVTEDMDPVLVENATSAINLVQYIQTHKNQKIVARQVADILIRG